MDNRQIITTLRQMLAELDKRERELADLERKPGGEPHELADRLVDIHFQQATLLVRRHHLGRRLADRELIDALDKSVPALSETSATRLNTALAAVSKSIAQQQEFDAALGIISAAVSAAENAARMTRAT